MEKTVYLMEQEVMVRNRGSLKIDLDYCTKLKGLTNDEIAAKLKLSLDGEEYVTDGDNIYPKHFGELSDEIKNEFVDEEDYKTYVAQMVCLRECYNERQVQFDKVTNEDQYLNVE